MFAKQPPEVQEFLLRRHTRDGADYTQQDAGRSDSSAVHQCARADLPRPGHCRVAAAGRADPLRRHPPVGWLPPAGCGPQFAGSQSALHQGTGAAHGTGPSGIGQMSQPATPGLLRRGPRKTRLSAISPTPSARRRPNCRPCKDARSHQRENDCGGRRRHKTVGDRQFADEKDAQGKPLRPHFDRVHADHDDRC